jgi:hypothetical protein
MSDRSTGPDGIPTIGQPVSAAPLDSGPLFVGPPEDPDRYELFGEGIRGGEGRTWRAAYRGALRSPLIQAVKMLFPPTSATSGWPTESDLQRWRDQAALLRHLAQPNVVRFYDIFGGEPPHAEGTAGAARPSAAYLLMEWVEGPTLAELLRGSPVTANSLTERLQYVNDIATAVAALHSYTRSAGNPVLHRDLTPANCIVHDVRGVVLIDISGMRLIDDGFDPLGRHTPAYSAPEVRQAQHVPREPSSDLYAIGALAAFCLTGDEPPLHEADGDPLRKRLTNLLRAANVQRPAAAASHLMRMLSPDPQQRPADLLAWSRTLTSLAAPVTGAASAGWRRARRRPLAMVVAGVLAAAAIATAGVVLSQHDHGTASNQGDQGTTTNFQKTVVVNGLTQPLDASKGFAEADFASSVAQITSPKSGQAVRDCDIFSGTSKLPPGQTLMLAMHDLTHDDRFRWVQVAFGWDHPATLAKWRGAQFFNPESIGHRTLVEVIEMPLNDALRRANDNNDMTSLNQLAWQGKVVAAVTVIRVNKKKNPDCS